MDKHINTLIQNKYKIKKQIATGCLGRIYLGDNLESKQKVVLKIIKKKGSKIGSKIESQIIRDSEIPNLIIHKNIIRVIDFVSLEKYSYIIYPYMRGATSLSLIKTKKLNFKIGLNVSYIASIFHQISDAVSYMHSNKVIHRDIKPHNILIDDNNAFLIDFDLAFVVDNPRYPVKKGMVGTPYYLAPELWMRKENIDYYLTDIYSLGVTFYYIFNQKHYPYAAKTMEQLEYSIRNLKPFVSLSDLPMVDKLIMSMISKDPPERPDIEEIKTVMGGFWVK